MASVDVTPTGKRAGGEIQQHSFSGRVDQEDCIWEVMLGHGDTRVGLCRRSITQVSPSIALQ